MCLDLLSDSSIIILIYFWLNPSIKCNSTTTSALSFLSNFFALDKVDLYLSLNRV